MVLVAEEGEGRDEGEDKRRDEGDKGDKGGDKEER